MSLIFVFLDGFGLGRLDESNPYILHPSSFLRRALGAPLGLGLEREDRHLLLRALDAGLGVPGAPQSATGQTALFTGVNAPALVGEHLSAYPNGRLREIIAEHSILKRARERGKRALLANAYSLSYWELVTQRRRYLSASTLTNMAADLPFRSFEDLARGEALYWDITHSTYRLRYGRLDGVRLRYRRPEDTGRALATMGATHDLVLFESFLPDMVGHRKLPHTARWAVYVIDRFLEAVVESMRPQDTVLVSSDHGNFEDLETKLHTENPVPLLVIGPAAPAFAGARRITDVAPAILSVLGTGHAVATS